MATKYDQTPTSINSHEAAVDEAEQQRLAQEALAQEQERADRIQQAGEAMGGLATEQAYRTTEEDLLQSEEGVVIEGNFGGTEATVQEELHRLEQEARVRIQQLEQGPDQLAQAA